MTDTPKAGDTLSNLDIHLDLDAEQLHELRAGKKVLVLADKQSGDQVRVGTILNGPITWKQAGMFLTIIAGLATNIYFVAVRTAQIQLAIEKIDPLAQEMVTAMSVLAQHGEEFAMLRADMTTILDLYTRLDAKVDEKTKDGYTQLQANADSATHREFHRLEREAWDARLKELRTSLAEHERNQNMNTIRRSDP